MAVALIDTGGLPELQRSGALPAPCQVRKPVTAYATPATVYVPRDKLLSNSLSSVVSESLPSCSSACSANSVAATFSLAEAVCWTAESDHVSGRDENDQKNHDRDQHLEHPNPASPGASRPANRVRARRTIEVTEIRARSFSVTGKHFDNLGSSLEPSARGRLPHS